MRRSFRWAAPLALAALGALLAVAGCVPSEAEGEEPVANEVLVTAFEVAGPGAAGPGSAPGELNRTGSASVPVRSYEPGGGVEPWATLVWAHGGSFVRGTLDWPEADWVARSFAEAGLRVLSVDYVLASGTVKAPAPSNDVAAVLAWAGGEFAGPLVAGGASAGAHLAVLATLAHGDAETARPVAALLLEYPTLHREQRADPDIADLVATLPEARRFRADRIAEMYEFYLGQPVAVPVPGDEAAPPAATAAVVAGELPPERLAQLPATIIVNADADELRASGEEFAEQLRAAGVRVVESLEPGTVHGYLNRPEVSPAATAQSRATIDRFVRELRGILTG